MDRKRLLELAGMTDIVSVGSNMGNPSQEPNAEIDASAEAGMRSPSTDGFKDPGDDGDTSFSGLRDTVNSAIQGGNPEEMVAALKEILAIIDGDGEAEGEVDADAKGTMDVEQGTEGDVEMEIDLGRR